MLSRFKAFIETMAVSVDAADEEHALRLACAVLMFEILRADHQVHPAEEEKISRHIQVAFDLDDDETQAVMQQAREHSETAISLHDVVRTVNEHYDLTRKQDLLMMLWDVAYADGELDPHEEYAIRKLADLLYVPHRDFIRTKHQVISGS